MTSVAFRPFTIESGLAAFAETAARRKFKAREVVQNHHKGVGHIYMVMRGTVSLAINDPEGRTLITGHLGRGEIFGEQGLFASKADLDNMPQVIARSNGCELAALPHSEFQSLASRNPEVMISVYKRLSERIQSTTRRMVHLAFLDISGRIEKELIELCRHEEAATHPDGMQIKITRQELARMVNCSREMVGRILKKMEEDGRIEVHGKTIIVYGTR